MKNSHLPSAITCYTDRWYIDTPHHSCTLDSSPFVIFFHFKRKKRPNERNSGLTRESAVYHWRIQLHVSHLHLGDPSSLISLIRNIKQSPFDLLAIMSLMSAIPTRVEWKFVTAACCDSQEASVNHKHFPRHAHQVELKLDSHWRAARWLCYSTPSVDHRPPSMKATNETAPSAVLQSHLAAPLCGWPLWQSNAHLSAK